MKLTLAPLIPVGEATELEGWARYRALVFHFKLPDSDDIRPDTPPLSLEDTEEMRIRKVLGPRDR
jgi:hypothetical protein